MADFCPISLCTTFYKVVAKVLTNKLKLNLPHIIINTQSTFIRGRDISNNIAFEQELCGELHSGKHGKGFCAKFILRKAFDTISREAILYRMGNLGFPTPFIDLINACIINILFSINCNGSIIGYFHSSNGLRQGCPLSPFLFAIAIDILSDLMDHEVTVHNFPLY